MPPFPARTLAECNAIMYAPGMPWEMVEIDDINGAKVRAYKSQPPSLRYLWLSTKVHAKADYLVFEDERMAYAEAHDKVTEIANLFKHEYGCVKGDRIAIASRNLTEWILCFWAIEVLGCVAVAVNAWLPLDALNWCIADTECKVVILDSERAKILAGSVDAIKASGTNAILVFRPTKLPAGTKSFDSELRKYAGRTDVPEVSIAPEDIATIFFTSGTTGLPKGVVGTQRQWLTNVINMLVAPARALLRMGENLPAPDPTAPQKGTLISVPLFHATGNHSAMGVATAMGMKIGMMHKWNTPRAAELIIREKFTSAGGMPFMAMELVESLALRKGGHMLEGISYGGGPAAARLGKSIVDAFPGSLPGQGYGATELSSACATVVGIDFVLRPTSTGLPCPVNDIKIVDENGKTLPARGIGEILVRGANRTNGYWKNKEATKEVFLADGFYKTGDIGYMDEDDFLYILDRAKDIIIRGGENIATVTVENALYQDKRLLDVSVVPVPDDKLGELVAAAVVIQPEYHGKVTEAELMALVATQLRNHYVPVLIDIRTQTLPRNAVGKTLKKEIRIELEELWAERKTRKAKL